MNHRFGKTIVVSLGGSIIYPNQIDIKFLKQFNSSVRKFIKKDYKFVIVTGGGKPARIFQEAAYKVSQIKNDDKDWLGIHATRLNAHLLRTIFQDIADPVIFDIRYKIKKLAHPVTIGSGWRPGWSTDFVSAQIAADFKVKEFINAGKAAYVFERDPKKFPKAKKFEKLSWAEYRKLIPAKWIPGFSSPVDPVAARLCQKEKITAVVINGKNLKNFENLLQGQPFQGTIVQ
ncbi:MAG: UMP kinase [Candidatus Liptonbacteria bacterium]|nr:UMP kinase [Candidatus Liptonbacteria bacterium]